MSAICCEKRISTNDFFSDFFLGKHFFEHSQHTIFCLFRFCTLLWLSTFLCIAWVNVRILSNKKCTTFNTEEQCCFYTVDFARIYLIHGSWSQNRYEFKIMLHRVLVGNSRPFICYAKLMQNFKIHHKKSYLSKSNSKANDVRGQRALFYQSFNLMGQWVMLYTNASHPFNETHNYVNYCQLFNVTIYRSNW